MLAPKGGDDEVPLDTETSLQLSRRQIVLPTLNDGGGIVPRGEGTSLKETDSRDGCGDIGDEIDDMYEQYSFRSK